MAIRITPDGPRSRVTYSWDGPVADREFVVRDMEGISHAQLWLALQDPSVPDTDANDPHPTIPGIVAVNKTITPSDAKQASIMVRYETPTPENAPGLGGQTLTIDATSTEVDDYFDQLGQRYSATYVGAGFNFTHYPRVRLAKNLVTFTFEVIENVTEEAVATRAERFVETVNAAIWNGWEARSWKVDDIQGRPWGNSRTWQQVRTVLTRKKDTWDVLTVALLNQEVPNDATEGNGFRRQRGRDEEDLTLLPITMPAKP